MGKVIIISLLLFACNDDYVDIYHNHRKIAKISIEQYRAMHKSYKHDKKLQEAIKNGKMNVIVLDKCDKNYVYKYNDKVLYSFSINICKELQKWIN